MRKRVHLLLLPFLSLLAIPLPVLAAPQCEGEPVAATLPENSRMEQLADRGFACLQAGKPVRSIAWFSELIGASPTNARGYLNRGGVYMQLGQLDAGLEDYSQVVKFEPEHFEGWYNRGLARLAMRQYDEAIADLTEAIRLRPDMAHAYCNRGLSYLSRSERARARSDFDKGLELRVDMPLCYFGRGEVELADGQYQDAIETLTHGINLQPTAKAFVSRATAYERLGERDNALKDYRDALSLRPGLDEAQAGVARLADH